MNEDYRKGYRDGFEDGHKAGAASGRNLNPYSKPIPIPHPTTASVVCPECGMEWKGLMGYVCPNMKCPVQPKVTSYAQWE